MKRSFSLKELQSAIDEQHSNASKHSMVSFLDETDSNAGDPPGGPPPGLVSSRESLMMRKSKSMTSFSDAISDQMLKDGMRPKDIKLLPLTSMVLTNSDSDSGPEEETKRGKGVKGRFSGSGRGLLLSASERASVKEEEVETVCLETLGAASALMQLSSFQPDQHRAAPPNSESPTRSTGMSLAGRAGGGDGGGGAYPSPPFVNGMQIPPDAKSMLAAAAAAAQFPGGIPAAGMQSGMLPSLRFVLDGINSQSVQQQQQQQQQHALAQHLVVAHQQQILIQQQQQQQQMQTSGSAAGVDSTGAAESKGAGGVAGGGAAEGAEGGGEEAKHNKYCHFCQHVKVKRATSMLACVNQECARRFCEHCLVTHLNDSVPKQHEAGSWVCPICRKTCCCAFKTCERSHRHCKAFRYRQRRAEQAAKRSLNAAGGAAARPGIVAGGPVSPSKDAEGGGSPEAATE